MARDEQLKERWDLVVEKLSIQFADGDRLDLDSIIYHAILKRQVFSRRRAAS